MKQLTVILSLFFVLTKLVAQEMTFIPENAAIYVGDANAIGVFGNLRNDGNIAIKKNGQLFFMGKIWMNNPKSKITDGEMVKNSISGGTIHFFQVNNSYPNQGQQILHSGYTDKDSSGPSFANIVIDNNAGVIVSSDMHVLNNLHFKRGHLYLNQYHYISGDTNFTGNFTGYSQQRFIVTGNILSGSLVKYRQVKTGQQVTFPLGPENNIYSPLQIINNGKPDAFMARAFENVYAQANSGNAIKDSTTLLTWILLKSQPETSEVVVKLQHDMPMEDPVFKSLRNASYVSCYDSATGWDKPVFSNIPQASGSITTSFPNSTSLVNTRKLYMGNSPMFMSKKVSNKKPSFTIPNAFSPNGDGINDKWNIKGLQDFDKCVVDIYNRYGQHIFNSYGYRNPWDGTFNSKPVPVGVYYYIIDLKNGEKPLSGSVTLLR